MRKHFERDSWAGDQEPGSSVQYQCDINSIVQKKSGKNRTESFLAIKSIETIYLETRDRSSAFNSKIYNFTS